MEQSYPNINTSAAYRQYQHGVEDGSSTTSLVSNNNAVAVMRRKGLADLLWPTHPPDRWV
jgi:hypothetical protein